MQQTWLQRPHRPAAIYDYLGYCQKAHPRTRQSGDTLCTSCLHWHAHFENGRYGKGIDWVNGFKDRMDCLHKVIKKSVSESSSN